MRPHRVRTDVVPGLALGVTALLCSVAVLAACGGDDDPPVHVFGRDATAIEVRVGELFAVELAANPSIGDDWRIVEKPDERVARLLEVSYEAESDDETVVGGGGTATFRFEAVAGGITRVAIFNCYRCGSDAAPSAENEPLSETLRFAVTVS